MDICGTEKLGVLPEKGSVKMQIRMFLILILHLNQVHHNHHQKTTKKTFLNYQMTWFSQDILKGLPLLMEAGFSCFAQL
jgi:hypothetical protein